MYARLGNTCPYNMSNTYQTYYTLENLEKGKNRIGLNAKKYLIRDERLDKLEKPQVYLESPFIEKIITPEQTKVSQNPQSIQTR